MSLLSSLLLFCYFVSQNPYPGQSNSPPLAKWMRENPTAVSAGLFKSITTDLKWVFSAIY